MLNATENLIALNRANVEAAVQAANIALHGLERLVEVQLSAAKAAVADSARAAKATAEAKDLSGLLALQASLAGPGMEKAAGFSRSVYEIATQTQAELTKLAEERIADFNRSAIAALEQAAKAAPSGTGADAAVALVKSAVAAASSAYDTLSKTAKQVAELTEANVAAFAGKAAPAAGKKAA